MPQELEVRILAKNFHFLLLHYFVILMPLFLMVVLKSIGRLCFKVNQEVPSISIFTKQFVGKENLEVILFCLAVFLF